MIHNLGTVADEAAYFPGFPGTIFDGGGGGVPRLNFVPRGSIGYARLARSAESRDRPLGRPRPQVPCWYLLPVTIGQ